MTTIIIICILGWYCIGALGFCYWWTSEFDITMDEIPTIIMAGFMGPLSWIAGACIHRKPIIIWRKR